MSHSLHAEGLGKYIYIYIYIYINKQWMVENTNDLWKRKKKQSRTPHKIRCLDTGKQSRIKTRIIISVKSDYLIHTHTHTHAHMQ